MTHASTRLGRRSVLALGGAAAVGAALPMRARAQTTLRYGHNNEPASVAGAQADWFAT